MSHAEPSNLRAVSVMSVTQFSGSPSRAIRDAVRQPIMVVNHHRPVAYLVSAEQWRVIVERLREIDLDDSGAL